jgi:hypothetical protein
MVSPGDWFFLTTAKKEGDAHPFQSAGNPQTRSSPLTSGFIVGLNFAIEGPASGTGARNGNGFLAASKRMESALYFRDDCARTDEIAFE